MKNLIVVVGRPNVGKSSFFNALVRKKKALVKDFEGVTRDRRMEKTQVEALGGRTVTLCDTGGWMPEEWRRGREDKEILEGIEAQIKTALEDAAVIVVLVDARAGLTPLDDKIFNHIRKFGKPFVVAANKCDVSGQTYQMDDFYAVGADAVMPVSAEHKLGIHDFWQTIGTYLSDEEAAAPATDLIKVCIVGRPNVGKSTILNLLVGEQRSVATDIPGTTTDPVDVEIERAGRKFLLIDTAGIRRSGKRGDEVEDLAVMVAQRNLEQADLAFFVINAEDGVTMQDSRIGALVEDSGCAAIVLANKWDKAPREIHSGGGDSITKFREMMEKEWPFLDYAPLVAVSAQAGRVYGAAKGSDALDAEEPWRLPQNFDQLWNFALDMIAAREQKISAEELTKVVDAAMDAGPKWASSYGELRRIHQVGNRPPQFLAFVKDANKMPEALRRYLKRVIREKYGYRGNPIRWVFRHKGER